MQPRAPLQEIQCAAGVVVHVGTASTYSVAAISASTVDVVWQKRRPVGVGSLYGDARRRTSLQVHGLLS